MRPTLFSENPIRLRTMIDFQKLQVLHLFLTCSMGYWISLYLFILWKTFSLYADFQTTLMFLIFFICSVTQMTCQKYKFQKSYKKFFVKKKINKNHKNIAECSSTMKSVRNNHTITRSGDTIFLHHYFTERVSALTTGFDSLLLYKRPAYWVTRGPS